MNQKLYIFCPVSTFCIHSTIFDGPKVSHTLSLDRNLSSKSTTPSISYIVSIIVYILNGTVWHVALKLSLIVHTYH